MIETLDISKSSEALNVLKQAFADHPVLPPGTPLKTREAVLKLMLDTFGSAENAWLHGIHKDAVPVCVAFSLDSQSEPQLSAILWFFFKLFRLLGWRMTREFIRAFSKREKYDDCYLELWLLGTLPAFQGQGLGKTMLEFLYDFAEEHGYSGVILSAAKETPAFRFYVKEGFVVDSEIAMNNVPVCNMRRDSTE